MKTSASDCVWVVPGVAYALSCLFFLALLLGCDDEPDELLLRDIGGSETVLDVKAMTKGTYNSDSMIDHELELVGQRLQSVIGGIAGNMQRGGLATINPEASIEHLGFPYTREEYDFGDGRKGRFRCWLQNDPKRQIAFLSDTPYRLPRTNKLVYLALYLDCRLATIEPGEFTRILDRSSTRNGIVVVSAQPPEDLIDSGVERAGNAIVKEMGLIAAAIRKKNRDIGPNTWIKCTDFHTLFGEDIARHNPANPKQFPMGDGASGSIFFWLPYDPDRKIAFITSLPLRRRGTNSFSYLAAKTDGTLVRLDLHETIELAARSPDPHVRFHPLGVSFAVSSPKR